MLKLGGLFVETKLVFRCAFLFKSDASNGPFYALITGTNT